MSEPRYLIIDLNSELRLALHHDLQNALEEAEYEPFSSPAWEEQPDLLKAVDSGLYSPDIVVVDQVDDQLYAPHRGEIVRCWWDEFTGAWRRILQAAA